MDWDSFYIGLAEYVSRKSKDPSTKCGAVIVRPDRTVASIGFNGFPRKMRDDPAWLNNREEKYARVIHAEMNALLSSKEPLTDCTLYVWPFAPCERCAVHIAQAGISKVVCPPGVPGSLSDSTNRADWQAAFRKTEHFLALCGVELKFVEEQ